ncbi:hypothetical protein [Vibrio spartinae]|uniref:Uncharacterized protein n=1 Tax=Vibrio spartinae TaxID=1918945 RepID=A0A1N6LZL1_9VIBR|nr:hypothetical protein [Vibrio spartinae]QMV16827.1 hypothetical protein Vspart_04239 [Vibrio spartinae]SIO92619.1 hypothetical protein VSP9026_00233 [Vibrio spartinae]
MAIAYRQISIDDDLDLCIDARKDAYFCRFGHYDGFDDFIRGIAESWRTIGDRGMVRHPHIF